MRDGEILPKKEAANVREYIRKLGCMDAIVLLEQQFSNAIEDASKEKLSLRNYFVKGYRQPKDYLIHFRYRFGRLSREHLFRIKTKEDNDGKDN